MEFIGKIFDLSTYSGIRAFVIVILDVIIFGVFALSYLMYRKYKKLQEENPEYEDRQEESLREKHRQEQKNRSLDAYMSENDSDYLD